MATITVVGCNKGGVGKTTLATILVDMMTAAKRGHLSDAVEKEIARGAKRSGQAVDAMTRITELCTAAEREVVVVDGDVQMGGAAHSALSRRIADTLPYATGVSLEALQQDPFAANKHFDMLGRSMQEGGLVADLGAGVVSPFLEWVSRTNLALDLKRAGMRLDFVTVTTDRAAMTAAADTLAAAEEAFGGYDGFDFRSYLAMNEAVSPFSSVVGTPEWNRLVPLVDVGVTLPRSAIIRQVSLARGASELFQRFEASDQTPTAILTMSEEAIADTFGVTSMEARRGRGDYLVWVWRMFEQAYAAGLVGDGVVRDTNTAAVVNKDRATALRFAPPTKRAKA
jgi:hypothetical protein